MEFLANCGTQVAFLGATLAVALACAGSGIGCGSVGEAGTGVLSEDPGKFASVLIMQILPGTQGLYGLVIWFFALMKMGFFSGSIAPLTIGQGLGYFAACLPIGIGGLVTAIAQGRCAATGVMLMAKRPEEMSKGIVMALIIEFYAVLCLLASFLMLNSF
ncbi:MAG: V-type ATP synthase subunit K [Oscillospiraceae bacterium]|nr:V-type ATP synthase subunit K [Oscillospiraceae bacterium]